MKQLLTYILPLFQLSGMFLLRDAHRAFRCELIHEPPRPSFWRAPNDNDFGGNWQTALAVWKSAGDRWEFRRVRVERTGPHEVTVSVTGRIRPIGARYGVTYRVLGAGDVTVAVHFEPEWDTMPRMPRFGMRMAMPAGFDRIAWYGRGPHESYWDRKVGARVRRFNGTVAEQFHPYVRPQETGNKTDVRWMTVSDDAGIGLLDAPVTRPGRRSRREAPHGHPHT